MSINARKRRERLYIHLNCIYYLLNFSDDKYMSKWFIGLDFNKSEGMNIDLTSDIQSFVENGKMPSFVSILRKLITNFVVHFMCHGFLS